MLKTRGLSSVCAGIGYLDNGESDSTVVDAFDVATFFADMRSMLNRIGAMRTLIATGATPEVHAGPWCDYCPSMAYCPAHSRLAMTMLGELEYVQKEIAFFTPEQVSKAWDLKKRIESMLETVDESLRLRIQQSVIPRPNGKRLAMVEQAGRASFDTAKAISRIKEYGGDVSDLTKKGKPFFKVAEVNMNGAGK